jgi:hypothetical protein
LAARSRKAFQEEQPAPRASQTVIGGAGSPLQPCRPVFSGGANGWLRCIPENQDRSNEFLRRE